MHVARDGAGGQKIPRKFNLCWLKKKNECLKEHCKLKWFLSIFIVGAKISIILRLKEELKSAPRTGWRRRHGDTHHQMENILGICFGVLSVFTTEFWYTRFSLRFVLWLHLWWRWWLSGDGFWWSRLAGASRRAPAVSWPSLITYDAKCHLPKAPLFCYIKEMRRRHRHPSPKMAAKKSSKESITRDEVEPRGVGGGGMTAY